MNFRIRVSRISELLPAEAHCSSHTSERWVRSFQARLRHIRTNYSVRALDRFPSLLAISFLRTPSIKLERLLFSSFASTTNLPLRPFSILNDIVVSFIVSADSTTSRSLLSRNPPKLG